ncbi:MAG: GMC family oxidoreductase [Caldilineaceae bacterium]
MSMSTSTAPTSAYTAFNSYEARTATAIFERMFPADQQTAGATDIGVVDYVDRALAGAYSDQAAIYHTGLAALDRVARRRHGAPFAGCTVAQQNKLLADLEQGALPDFYTPVQSHFFALLRTHLQEGLFADPLYGGNQNKLGWATLGHPGVWLENSAAENLSAAPVTKGGVIQSMADLGYPLAAQATGQTAVAPAASIGYDPQLGAQPPTGAADVILVGLGAVGGLIAPVLAEAGLRVVALEAGPYRTKMDFLPDELGATYYGRANMGSKFLSESPQWRRNSGDETEPATFSLGRMVNGVGGSAIHYGAWLRRFHPHHFAPHTRVAERWGVDVLPTGCTLDDWPVTYADLEPYYDQLDHLIGIAGPAETPFIPRRAAHPMPPLRPFRLGEFFTQATQSLGLHPYPVPVGLNSVPYASRPATTYTAWVNGFGCFNDAKWQPGLTSVPQALATGNLTLRTHCRVLRILTDSQGHADGVEYVDANGKRQVQRARTVILCSYTFENVRLLLLSGDQRHPQGLGNNQGQVGRHFMTKMFAHVDGYFPDVVFNRHTGPASQGIILDDYLADDFDSVRHGFVGGATLGAEQQFLPIQISREALPPDVSTWGQGYKEHLLQWQHFGVVRIQPDTLPYVTNYLDLDPHHRDRSGYGLPVVRITYDMRANEQRLADWMEGKAEEILRIMGASKCWRGPRFTGVGSSHDLGGCRFGHDPATTVLNAELGVHDTPGLYVFGGTAFPSCPGINPTLTIWALCLRAAERLVARLEEGQA